MRSVFECTDGAALYEYLLAARQVYRFDLDVAYSLAQEAIRHQKQKRSQRESRISALQSKLMDRWYASLRDGQPDYSVYDDDFYISNLWSCWIIYSRKYLAALTDPRAAINGALLKDTISPVQTVVDLGCGFGYTSAGLKELFPAAQVVGTNFPGTKQYALAERIGKQRGFTLVGDVADLDMPQADLVFASEYFEHVYDPITHLNHIVGQVRPKTFIIANAFGSKSIGHFDEYEANGGKVSNKTIGRLFNKALRDCGYRMVKTKLWNNRPSIWMAGA